MPAPEFSLVHRFPIPTDPGRRVALVRTLWESIAEGAPQSLIWVTAHGIWPSGEHRPLAEAARASWGAATPLSQQPGHLASPGEQEQALSLLVLAVLFLWDLWLLAVGTNRAAHISHDEVASVYVSSPSEHDVLAQRLAGFSA